MEEKQGCPSCGSTNIELDDSTAEKLFVCISCGTVVEDCCLQSSDTAGTAHYASEEAIHLSEAPDRFKKYVCNTVPYGKKAGFIKIHQLASIFKLSQEMKSSAKNLFSDAYSSEFYKSRVSKKVILAACCVYIVLRQCNQPVVLEDMCQYVDGTHHLFHAVHKRLEAFRKSKLSALTTEELVRSVMRHMIMEDKEKIIQKTVAIINICYECWILSGRSRKQNIIASSYLAWVSHGYKHAHIKFPEFFSMFQFPKQLFRTASLRCKEITSVFIQHAKKLPWVEGYTTPNKKNIFLHVDHVLKHYRFLHNSIVPDGVSSNSDVDVAEYNKFRSEGVELGTTTKSYGGTENMHLDKETNICEDEDISDTEIDTYIRSDEEAVKYLAFRNAVMGNHSSWDT